MIIFDDANIGKRNKVSTSVEICNRNFLVWYPEKQMKGCREIILEYKEF